MAWLPPPQKENVVFIAIASGCRFFPSSLLPSCFVLVGIAYSNSVCIMTWKFAQLCCLISLCAYQIKWLWKYTHCTPSYLILEFKNILLVGVVFFALHLQDYFTCLLLSKKIMMIWLCLNCTQFIYLYFLTNNLQSKVFFETDHIT